VSVLQQWKALDKGCRAFGNGPTSAIGSKRSGEEFSSLCAGRRDRLVMIATKALRPN
jgi:hypothetical protein